MGCLKSKEEKPVEPMKEPEAKTIDKRLPFENYRQFFNTKNSWKVIARSMEKAAQENMLIFFEKHPEHKDCHPELKKYDTKETLIESTDFEIVSMAMFNQLDMFFEKAEGETDEAIKALQRHGKMQSRVKGFTVQYFKDMEESFIAAAKEVMIDRFTEAAEKNLHLVYSYACEQFIEGYNSAVAAQGGGQQNADANRI